MAQSAKSREEGNKIGFGQKSTDFLKKKSRDAVETYSDTPVLYFEVDVENSKRNFYGEMIVKKWKNPKGTKVKGTVNVKESTEINLADLPNKLTQLEFSCYIDHLKDIGIWPQMGDYISVKNRFYYIQTKELLDSNKHVIMTDKDAYSITFKCGEADDETVLPSISQDDDGTANEFFGSRQYNPPYHNESI